LDQNLGLTKWNKDREGKEGKKEKGRHFLTPIFPDHLSLIIIIYPRLHVVISEQINVDGWMDDPEFLQNLGKVESIRLNV